MNSTNVSTTSVFSSPERIPESPSFIPESPEDSPEQCRTPSPYFSPEKLGTPSPKNSPEKPVKPVSSEAKTSDFSSPERIPESSLFLESPEKSPEKPVKPVISGSKIKGIVKDVEDTLEEDLNNLTMKGKKHFSFRRDRSKSKSPPRGAASLDFWDEEDDEDDSAISANFDLEKTLPIENDSPTAGHDIPTACHDSPRDSDSGDSDIQFVPVKKKTNPLVVLSDSDDDIAEISKKLQGIPLGQTQKAAAHEPPRQAIFLNTPPPIEKKTYSYNPQDAKHKEFYGDVQRTVAMLAKTIEEMPAPDDGEELELPKGLVNLFDHQLYGLRWLSWREREFPGGGILADEMGLGKTIMIIALIMKSKMEATEHRENEDWVDVDEIGNCIRAKATLVVCPVGCIVQWNDEINSKGKGLRVYMYHGPNRTTSAAQLAQYDVVLTTYHTITHEIPKEDKQVRYSKHTSPLQRVYWKRIVLDEAHNIRNVKTGSSQGICKLNARHRWAVTGTPIHNRPSDFFSMTKFLKLKPFDDSKVWDFWIGLKKVRANDAQQRLNIIGKAIILRRTKKEVEDAGGNVRKIPPKTVELVNVELCEGERKLYDYLREYAKSMLKNFMQEKENRENELNAAAMTYTVDSHRKKKQAARVAEDGVPTDVRFSHLFALLTRMRQCAVLPYLIHTMLEDEEIDEDVSFDEMNDEHLISKMNPAFDRMYVSSKFERIFRDLEDLRDKCKKEGRPMEKVVLISSWTSNLELIAEHLRRRRFSTIFITGKENAAERADNMKKFNQYPERYNVCMLSLMAGGVGLNLVGGNHVYFVEPHWNPQMELQAQDRVHRFGQTKDVTVRRYICKETVEDRIMAIQDEKLHLADEVLNSAKRSKNAGLSLFQLKKLFE